MMKRMLSNWLGRERYLRWVAKGFDVAYRSGRLRSNPVYAAHYVARDFIKSGDVVIDLGGNLGYYAKLFGEWVGAKGAVYTVEPVKLYRDVLISRTYQLPQVHVLPYAIGLEPGIVHLSLVQDDITQHGQTSITESGIGFEAEMKTPQQLFGQLSQLNYIKCDIEGYERIIMPEMMFLFNRFKPILQIETGIEMRRKLYDMLQPLGYKLYTFTRTGIEPLVDMNQRTYDVIYIPE